MWIDRGTEEVHSHSALSHVLNLFRRTATMSSSEEHGLGPDEQWSFVSLDATDVTIESSILKDMASVSCLGARSQADIPDSISDADVVALWHSVDMDAPLLARLTRCRCIIRMGVGYDNVDVAEAARLGIPVCNVPNYGTEEVADSALSHVLNLFRRTATLAARVAAGEGAAMKGPDAIAAAAGPHCRRIRGRTLGIVGCGRIGSAVAIRAKVFGLRVIVHDPWLRDGTEKALGVERAETLDELLAASDCVTLHCDANVTSRGLINAAALAVMPRGSFLVNTARGEIVDEAALADALRSGHLAGAALDVHCVEPFIVSSTSTASDSTAALSSPLAASDVPNLLCTPHSAWYSVESRAEMCALGAANARRVMTGQPVRCCVNADALPDSPRCAVQSARPQH